MRTLLVLVLGVAVGCGGSDSVWSSSVSQLVLQRSGGFGPPYQPTADCPTVGDKYTLVPADRWLGAQRCTPSATPPYALVRMSVDRTLSPTEYDALLPKLEALKVVSLDSCGADKPAVTLAVTTRSGTTEYADSFYSCNDNDDRPTIQSEALDAVAAAFYQLSFPQP